MNISQSSLMNIELKDRIFFVFFPENIILLFCFIMMMKQFIKMKMTIKHKCGEKTVSNFATKKVMKIFILMMMVGITFMLPNIRLINVKNVVKCTL